MLSLSQIIKDLKAKLSTANNNIINLSTKIQTNTNNIANINNKFSPSYNVNSGDIIRTDKLSQMNGYRLIEVIRAGGGSEDIKKLSSASISMQEIFSSWDRISCNPNPNDENNTQNYDQNSTATDQVLARGSYSYDATNEAIVCARNSDSFSAFLSNESYGQTYTIKYMMDQRIAPGKGGDDDALIYVLAYMVDAKGKFHTINVIRTAKEPNNGHTGVLALCYDVYSAWFPFLKTTPKVLAVLEMNNNNTAYAWSNNYTYVNVDRAGTTINLESEYPNQDLSGKYTLSWTLPSTKPDSWSQEQYDNVKFMLTNDTKIGFGTESNISAFRIVSQKGLFDQITVYDLQEDMKKIYKDGSVIKQESITILPNTMIYSVINGKFFYYRGRGSYIELLPRDKIESQILELQNSISSLEHKIDPNW